MCFGSIDQKCATSTGDEQSTPCALTKTTIQCRTIVKALFEVCECMSTLQPCCEHTMKRAASKKRTLPTRANRKKKEQQAKRKAKRTTGRRSSNSSTTRARGAASNARSPPTKSSSSNDTKGVGSSNTKTRNDGTQPGSRRRTTENDVTKSSASEAAIASTETVVGVTDGCDSAITNEILRLVGMRGTGKSICPSEVARTLEPSNWRPLMPGGEICGRAPCSIAEGGYQAARPSRRSG